MSVQHRTGAIEPRRQVQVMFDRIAPRYDLMNRLMTFGQDVRWRELAVRQATENGKAHILDVATGTGDLALAFANVPGVEVTGLDFASAMIDLAEAKRQPDQHVQFLVGDAMNMPFADGTFDACTIAFGLRNLPNYQAGLAEMARVLRPGGRLVCLELTPYRKPLLGNLFNAYFTHVVPRIGGLISGNLEAYSYLPQSVAEFPDTVSLAVLMRKAGFTTVTWRTLGGGTVALHTAVK